jgi:CubicO group peptidase (beta-lactamase class C family)
MMLVATTDRVLADIEEGMFTRGAQAVVSLAGTRVLDLAAGEDGLCRPVTEDMPFRVYCTLKPVTALAVAHLVADGAAELDRPLHEILPEIEAVHGGVTARHVLSHTAGLHVPSGVTIELVPPADREALLHRQRRAAGWRVGSDAAYSEYFGWQVLGRMIERLTGEPVRSYLRRAVLDPLGMRDTYIGMTPAEVAANRERVGINLDLRGHKPYPMLFERTERVLEETNAAYGGWTTARDLELLYRSLILAWDGEDVPGVPPSVIVRELCTASRPVTYDAVLDRECDYGLGFMTSLRGHLFGNEVSDLAFGHSGNVGSSFAFADPCSGLAVAVIFNGLVDPDSAFLRRPALVRSVYRDLRLGPTATDEISGEATLRKGLWNRWVTSRPRG